MAPQLPAESRYLDPNSYDELSVSMRFRLFAAGNRRMLALFSILSFGAAFNLATGDTLSDVVTFGMILLSFFVQVEVSQSIIDRAKKATAHGIPLPKSFSEVTSALHKGSIPLTAVTVPFTLILGYAWVAPQGSLASQLGPYAAFMTNVCLVLTIMTFSWSRFLEKIQAEKYGVLHGGLEVLFPVLAVSGVTSYISILSGVTHWEDSIAFYGPAIVLSLAASASFPAESRVSPRFAKTEVGRLDSAKSKLDSRLSWVQREKDSYNKEEFLAEVKKIELELSSIDKTRARYQQALGQYREIVKGAMAEVSSYIERREERETLVLTQSSNPATAEVIDAVSESVNTISFSFEQEPRSYLLTGDFDRLRQSVTTLNFSLILQTLGQYTPLVTKVEVETLSAQLDRSTFESFGPAMLRYTIMSNERDELAWMWGRAQSRDSALEYCFWLQEYGSSIEKYRQELKRRIQLFEEIVRLDPESEYAKISESVWKGKGSLASKAKSLEDGAALVGDAVLALEKVRKDLVSEDHAS